MPRLHRQFRTPISQLPAPAVFAATALLGQVPVALIVRPGTLPKEPIHDHKEKGFHQFRLRS